MSTKERLGQLKLPGKKVLSFARFYWEEVPRNKMAKGEGKGEGKGDGKGMAKGHGKGDGDEQALEAVCCLGALFIYCGWSCCCCIAENITGQVSLRRLHRSVRLCQPTELYKNCSAAHGACG